MSKKYYKESKKIFPKFNKETDTVIVGSSRDYNIAKMKNTFNRQKAALHLANMSSGNVRGIDLANKESNVVTRSKDNNNYNVYSLVDKDKAKNTVSPVNIKEEAYERQNRSMRKKHKKETGKTLGERQTSGTGSRRVSFACRFGSMAGSMTDKNGEPSRLAMALKKWGFSSKGEAKSFCSKNKES